VSNTPFSYFKGTSSEGGMRVPFIVSWPGRLPGGRILDAFAYATDFLPTVLDIAGVPLPGDEYKGKKLLRPTGTSLLPYLEGKSPAVHPPTEVIGYEGTGAQVVYRGDYKLNRDGAPWGDGRWRLFNVAADPTESRDLAVGEPERVRQLLAEVEAYNQRNGVVLPEAGYNPLKAVLANNWPILLDQMKVLVIAILVVLAGLIYLVVRLLRRGRAPRPA
jgi:arylsulfatase A-like enzyme